MHVDKSMPPSSVVPSDAAHVLMFYQDSLRRLTATDSTFTTEIFKHARHPREIPIISRFIKKSKNLFRTRRSHPTGIITEYSMTCYDRTANDDNLPRLSVYSTDQHALEIPRWKKLALSLSLSVSRTRSLSPLLGIIKCQRFSLIQSWAASLL